MLTNCGRVPLDMIGGQCDKRVCVATSVGSLQRRRLAPPFAINLIAISALYISTRGNFDIILTK